MRTLDLDAATMETALDCLGRGFPARPRSYWRDGLARMERFGDNHRLGVPPGRVLMAGDAAVGVMLTPATEHVGRDGRPIRVVDLSSWTVDTEHRWRAGAMLKAATADPAATYLDLTPTQPVEALLRALGFTALNDGVSLLPLPLAAAVPARAVAIDVADAPVGALDEPMRRMLVRHKALGLLTPLVGASREALAPMVLKPVRLRGIPGVQTVYCDDAGLLPRVAPALARWLMARGRMLLIHDRVGPPPTFAIPVRHRGRRYARGPTSPAAIDHTGTEFAFFDFY